MSSKESASKSTYFFQLLGPLMACLFWFFIELDVNNHTVSLMAGVAVWMCTWWFTEAVSLAVTALVPVFVMPILGIADSKLVAQQYSDSIIFLFIVIHSNRILY